MVLLAAAKACNITVVMTVSLDSSSGAGRGGAGGVLQLPAGGKLGQTLAQTMQQLVLQLPSIPYINNKRWLQQPSNSLYFDCPSCQKG